jgi:hypothetical protein
VLPLRELAAADEIKNNLEAVAANPKFKPKKHHQNFLNTWWRHAYRRDDMINALEDLEHRRYIGLSIVAAEDRASIYNYISTDVRPDASLQVFAFDDDYSFGILSSSIHREWFDERCSKLESRPRYTPTTVWNSFPWPTDPHSQVVERISATVADIIDLRSKYLAEGMPLYAQYDALRQPGRSALRDLHNALDTAVIEAYGFADEEDHLAQLLALNLAAVENPSSARSPGGKQFVGAYTSSYRLAADPLT